MKIKLENDFSENTYETVNKDLIGGILEFINVYPGYFGIQNLENHRTLVLWIKEEDKPAERIEVDIDSYINIRKSK